MEPNAHHLVLRLKNDRVIAPTLAEQRRLSRTVLELGRGFELLSFGLPDTHLHLVTAELLARAKELARRVAIALTSRLRLPGGFAPVHAEPIRTARHLLNATKYAIGQAAHHGLRGDPDFEGTNLPDLLGLRPLGAWTAEVVRRWLPRLQRATVLSWAGVESLVPTLGPAAALRRAAEAALALPSLRGASREIVAVRRAIVHLGQRELTDGQLGQMLDIAERTVRRLRQRGPDESWIRVLTLQLAWLTRPGRTSGTAGVFGADPRREAVSPVAIGTRPQRR